MEGKVKVQNLYFFIAGGGIISFAILLLGNAGMADWLVMQHNYDWQFSDFFRQIIYASDIENIYFNTGDAPFPPFAYCFFHLLYKVNPVDAPIELSSWKIVQGYQYNLLIFVMFMLGVTIFLVEVIKKILIWQKRTLIFIFSLLLSAPFMAGAIERGNIAIVVCVLLLWAMYLKDSENLWKRECALILIAVSAGLKIYPAVFGVIYLKEKRWKEAGRLLAYGILFFFLPFVFTGGITGIQQYIKIMGSFEISMAYRWTNIRSFWLVLTKNFGSVYDVYIGVIIENIYLIMCLLSMFRTKERWKEILFLAGILSLYIPNSYRYVAVYMAVPLVYWFSQQSGKWNDYIYCILFSLIFTIPTYSYFIGGEVDFYIFAPIYLLMYYTMFETWVIERK